MTERLCQYVASCNKVTSVTRKWIPFHWGVGKEEADSLSRLASKQEQSVYTMSNIKVKALQIRKTVWHQCGCLRTVQDSIRQLARAAQIIIFRLRAGHLVPVSSPWTENLLLGMNAHMARPETPNHISPSLMPTWNWQLGEVLWQTADLTLFTQTENLVWLGKQNKKCWLKSGCCSRK